MSESLRQRKDQSRDCCKHLISRANFRVNNWIKQFSLNLKYKVANKSLWSLGLDTKSQMSSRTTLESDNRNPCQSIGKRYRHQHHCQTVPGKSHQRSLVARNILPSRMNNHMQEEGIIMYAGCLIGNILGINQQKLYLKGKIMPHLKMSQHAVQNWIYYQCKKSSTSTNHTWEMLKH